MAPRSSTSSSDRSNSSGDEWVPTSQRPRRQKRRGVKRTTSTQVTEGILEQIGINPVVSTIQAENGGSAPSHSPTPPEHLVVDCDVAKSASKLSTSLEIMETKSPDRSADCASVSRSLDRMAPSSTSSSNESSSSGDEWVPTSQRPRCRERRGVKRTTSEKDTEGIVEQIRINHVVSTIQVENGSSAPSHSPTPPEKLVIDCAMSKSASKLSTNPEIIEIKSPDHSADCASGSRSLDRMAPSSTSSSSSDEWVPKSQRPRRRERREVKRTPSEHDTEGIVEQIRINPVVSMIQVENGGSAPSHSPIPPEQLVIDCAVSKSASKLSTNPEIMETKSPNHSANCSNGSRTLDRMAPSSTSSSNESSSSGDEWVPKSQRPRRRERQGVKRTTSEQITEEIVEQIRINPMVSTIQMEHKGNAYSHFPTAPTHLVVDYVVVKSGSKLSTIPKIMKTKFPADRASSEEATTLLTNPNILETKSANNNEDCVGPRTIKQLPASTEILKPKSPDQLPASASTEILKPKSPDHAPMSISNHYLSPALSSGSPRGTSITVMASPPQQPPATALLPTATPAHPATASQPLPRAFLATSCPQRASAAPPPPFVFTARPLNPNPSHASPAAASQRRAPHVAVGYPRANTVAVPIAPSQQPQVPTQSRLPTAAPRDVAPSLRPELPPRGVPIAPQPQPKVNPVPAVALTPSPEPQEQSNAEEREITREDSATMVIHGRKVDFSDSESGSLYALCRSWVRNGVPHEIQPSFVGNVAPHLPPPLPAAVVDSRMSGKDKEAENEEPKEGKNDTGEYTTAGLLKEHVDRAKKIRAQLGVKRRARIERYKQRLALLLPSPSLPPSEPGQHDRRP